MKKKIDLWVHSNPTLKKLIMELKIAILFIVVGVSNVLATPTYSQVAKVSLDIKNGSLEQVIDKIESQSEFYFIFNQKQIDVNRVVDIQADNKLITDILPELFKGTNVNYVVFDRKILLTTDAIENNLLAIASGTEPQQKQITGTVIGKDGTPLPGVNVLVTGTTKGALTDIEGKYSVDVPQGSKSLTFSFIGMISQEISIGTLTQINVTMAELAIGLNEVVVIGYGTQKKANLTGAVATTNGEELTKMPVANISNSLAGTMAGLIVNTRSGEPGADDAIVLIRGVGTMGNTSPLIVIDGIPDRQGGFDRLDPADIESFSVIKDASAAIYGARAANGVILITTKRGTSGEPILSFNTNTSFTQPTRIPKYLDSYEYAEDVNEYNSLIGQAPTYTADQLKKYKDGSDPLGYPNTNWWKTLMKPWSMQENDVLSLRGGTDKVKYYLSGQFLRENSMYKGGADYYKNENLRANVDINVTDNFNVGVDVMYRHEYRLTQNPNYANGGVFSELKADLPSLLPSYPNGKVGVGIGGGPDNSMIYVLNGDLGSTNINYDYLQTKYSFKWNLQKIVKGLHLDGYYSYDFFLYNDKGFNATPPPAYSYDVTNETYTEVFSMRPPNLSIENAKTLDQLSNIKLSYEKKFNNNSIEAFVAYEQSQETYTELDAYRTGFLSNNVPELFAGSTTGETNNSVTTETARQNYISRISYNYADRYLLDVNMRYDGSPNFPVGKRFGYFPGISGAWRISNEPFLHSSIIDNLKLRGSWGKLGNDAVNPFQYIQTYQLKAGQVSQYISAGYFYGSTPTQVPGFTLGPTPNVNITWEVATTSNLGFDLGLFHTLTASVDVFRSMRTNILIQPSAVIPSYTGLSLPDENLGKVLNQGAELELGYHKAPNGNSFSYFIKGNITFAVNKVMYEAEAASIPSYQRMTGHPLDSWLLYKAIGIFQNVDELNKYPHFIGEGVGDIIYKDVNGDGVINALDKVRTTQSATPKIMYGVTFGSSYKNFDITILFQGQAMAQAMLQPSGLNMAEQFYTDRWLTEGDNTYPRTFNGPTGTTYGSSTQPSTFWLVNDAFIRLKNVEIGYNFPKELMSKAKIRGVRIYISGNNLFSIDKFGPSYDPESVSGSSTLMESYPIQRQLNVGANVTF
jgi:TonB-linked SusC/RagA family outer membrane protein